MQLLDRRPRRGDVRGYGRRICAGGRILERGQRRLGAVCGEERDAALEPMGRLTHGRQVAGRGRCEDAIERGVRIVEEKYREVSELGFAAVQLEQRAHLVEGGARRRGPLFGRRETTTHGRANLARLRLVRNTSGVPKVAFAAGTGWHCVSPRGRLRLALSLGYVGAAALFLAWVASRTFDVGRMPLPRSQALGVGVIIIGAATLCGAWVALLVRGVERLLRVRLVPSRLDTAPVRAALALAALVSAALYYDGRYIEARRPVVTHLALGASATPEKSVRIVVLADLHLDEPREPFATLADKVNALAPDVVVLLGDTLNRPSALDQLHSLLRRIEAPFGKLAVRGNWDIWYWQYLPLLKDTGFRFLDGERVSLAVRGTPVHFVGLAYDDDETGEHANRLLASTPLPGWRIFLYHTPDLALAVHGADLYLAGHTHGGQISIPGFGPIVTLSKFGMRFAHGLSRIGEMPIYVSAGIGVEPMVPLRLGVPPEIVVVELGPHP